MRFMIKLLGLLGIVGATAATAIAIDRKRRMLAAPAKPTDAYRDITIIDAEIIGLSELEPSEIPAQKLPKR